jgi:hypothetical protein
MSDPTLLSRRDAEPNGFERCQPFKPVRNLLAALRVLRHQFCPASRFIGRFC